MRAFLLLPLLALALVGCNSSSSSVGVSAGTSTGSGGYYGVHYGTSAWWYDDYFYYWDNYYPWCCDNPEDFDEVVKKWWNGLDAERQQEIKDNYQNWQENNGQPDLSALQNDFATRWNSLTPEQRLTIQNNRQNKLSVSNPERAPRLPLDAKSATQMRTENGMLTPASATRVDSGLRASPHLPKSMATPGRSMARPTVQPGFPRAMSFPGIRRR